MKIRLQALEKTRKLFPVYLSALSLFSAASLAQQPAPRITAEIDNNERVVLEGSHSPMARPEYDSGRVPPQTRLEGLSIVFSRSGAQEVDLQALIAAQQDASSPTYQKWLTPEEFASRFGVADSDIDAVKTWLEKQGFTVEVVSRSKTSISFSGTVGQVEAAFGTELHYYTVGGKKHLAPSADISFPAALYSVVVGVSNLSSFRPRPRVKITAPQRAPKANFTSSQSGNHFLTPKDVATIYDINAAYNAGYNGTSQSIAVVGQSSIVVTDIEHFQSAAGLTTKDPTLVLVPNSGTATAVSGDEAESDLDLEYSGAIAKGATIYFVYTGNNSNYNVWDSVQYAVDNNIAPVISNSYGVCETALSSSDYSTLNGILAQAATQGQTVLAPSGDNGSTDCYGETGLTTAQQEALTVDFPASSQYVTGIGGTEFPTADVAASNSTYWQSASGTDVISSALSYIPEQIWNDDSSSSGLSAGGGGASTLTSRPSWQTGVTGIPSGNYRLVPDISLDASPNNAGYLYCSSDSASTGVTGSCSNGFRDSSNTYLSVAGGTSFGSPIFAGMVAILNQKLNSKGQGAINSTLYRLAADSTAYASAFHDITSGGNQCTAGSSYCSSTGTSEYPATTGYDEASGLGSVDFYNLLSVWPASSSSLSPSTTSLSAATTTPAEGGSDVITITVYSASTSISVTPTGTVTISVDNGVATSSIALSGGSTTYTFSSAAAGSHSIVATYSGDSTYSSSTGSLTLTVTNTSKSFSLSATNVTVSAGSSATSTVTITPQNGYTGTISFSVSSTPSLSNGCFSLPNTTVSGTSAISATLTVHTISSACASGAVIGAGGAKRKSLNIIAIATQNRAAPLPPQLAVTLAALLLLGLIGQRPRTLRAYAGFFLLVAICAVGFGCAGSSSSSNSHNSSKGTYTVTIVGTDTSSSSITAATTISLTVD